MICKHSVDNISKLIGALYFFNARLNGFKYFFVTVTIENLSCFLAF